MINTNKCTVLMFLLETEQTGTQRQVNDTQLYTYKARQNDYSRSFIMSTESCNICIISG